MADSRRWQEYQTNGSTAVRVEPRPQPGEERQPARKRPKRQKKALPRYAVDVLPVVYVFMVAVSCVCILFFSVMYIHAKTDLTVLTKEVSSLQSSLEEVRQDNQDLKNDIATSTNLKTIYEKATKKLGMVAADDSQVLYYQSSDSEYVRQKDDIPNE